MELSTTITPQQAADALGVDLYTLAYQLREAASKEFARVAEGVGNGARLPWSKSETEEEIEKPMRLLASAEACMKAYELTTVEASA
jgi:hypothetical protein